MRTNRIRDGLLADPMTPGATTDLRPVVQAARNEWSTQSPVNQTIADPGFQSTLNMYTPDPQLKGMLASLGVPPVTPDQVARSSLRAAIEGQGGRPQMPPTNPRMRGVLPELSDLAQGKAMGRPVTTMGEPPPQPPPIPGGDLPGGDDADLPSRPPLQNMQPVDSSYGDLFKKLRPYQ